MNEGLPLREMKLRTPLPDGELLIECMRGCEQLSQFFRFDLDLLSENHEIVLEDVIGEYMTVELDLPDGSQRFFNGCVSEFAYGGTAGRYARYCATLRPWLWLVSRASNCRIFEGRTTPQIVHDVLEAHGFNEVEDRLTAAYEPREYTVQYNESDAHFMRRIMEHAGIYFYFVHRGGDGDAKHTLVLADSPSSHDTVAGYEHIPYYPPQEHQRRAGDHIESWTVRQAVQTGVYALNDYDFNQPSADLLASESAGAEYANGDYEAYEYPGDYREQETGRSVAAVRLEERQARQHTFSGEGNARGMTAGAVFELEGFPRSDQNQQYLITAVKYELETDAYQTGSLTASGSGPVYRCRFDAVKAKLPFRPQRKTKRPNIDSVQTAVVLGNDSNQMQVDQHARVRVRFHWDRTPKQLDEPDTMSCWVRVSQAWAGKIAQTMHVPHPGEEVLVSFIEGDPDRPIISGRVHNGVNKPWRSLPGLQTRSYWHDAGGNFLEMEEKDGEQQIHLHSPVENADLYIGNTFDTGLEKAGGFINSINADLNAIPGPPAQTEGIALRTDKDIVMHAGGNIYTQAHKNWFEVFKGFRGSLRLVGSTDTTIGLTNTNKFGVVNSNQVGELLFSWAGTKQTMSAGYDYAFHKGPKKSKHLGNSHTTQVGKKETHHTGDIITKEKGNKEAWFTGVQTTHEDGDKFIFSESKVHQKIKKEVLVDSELRTVVVGGGGDSDTSRMQLEGGEIAIRCYDKSGGGKTEIILKKSGDITIESFKKVKLKAQNGIEVTTKAGTMKLSAPDVQAKKGKFNSKNISDRG